jgi:hypothetical protein
MSNRKNNKRVYEPPVIREIGGVFEQAMGISACKTGWRFSTDPCGAGLTPGSACSTGILDRACTRGGSDSGSGSCSAGFFG